MKKESIFQHIFKYTGLFGGVQGLNILIGLVRNKIIAMLLGPIGVGLISIYNTASAFLQNSTNFGLQMSGVRDISRAFDSKNEEDLQNKIRILRSWSIIVGLGGLIITMMLCRVLSEWAFSSDEYTLEFLLLAPVVAMAAIAGGETAILKATRRLKQLAQISVLGIIGTLIVSVPLYMKWGNDGIIPSLILIGVVQLILAVVCSYRIYPLKLSFSKKDINEGRGMINVGIAFMLAGVLNSGADFSVRTYLGDISMSLAGFYNVGYMITITYAGIVFAAMETDYFPHLSGVSNDTKKMNGAVNKQIEVSTIMISPLLVILMLSLPILIPLLFSKQFIPVIGMTQLAIIAIQFRTLTLPVSYIMLAKGDSKSFLFNEFIYDILLIVTIIFGYNNWGLDGTGLAIAITSFIYTIYLISYCSYKYDLELSGGTMKKFLVYLSFCLVTLCLVMFAKGFVYWSIGIVLILLSLLYSYRNYRLCNGNC